MADLGDQSFSALEDPVQPTLPERSVDREQERLRRWELVGGQLDQLDTTELSAVELTNHAVYREQIDTLTAQQRFKLYERPANADTSFWGGLLDDTRRVLSDEDEAESYLEQLQQIPSYFAQNTANMRSGAARGFAPPRVSMIGREAQVRSVAEATTVDAIAFWKPFEAMAGNLGNGSKDRLRERARQTISAVVQPAFAELLEFLTTEYFPSLPERIDISSQPDGEAFYRAQLREYTTTDLTPREIHETGLEAVDNIRTEMRSTANEAGFGDDVESMLEFMRHDPQFYETTPRGLLREAAWHAKLFDGIAHHYFGRLPRMRFGIEEPEPDLAPFYTFGRGGPHQYVLNTYNLPGRPLYSLPALTLHEGAPGHAFQIPFALEMTQHPAFRRKTYLSSYGEGWGLYTERLGVEMGMYETPFEIMGMLSFQMWRAVRLVVDPGIHAMGWSRERAQGFLRKHTAISEHEIVTEIDRYIAWPGQATSYYLGMLKIMAVRARAERKLGAGFSLRNFHDLVLSLGSVPLDVLDREVDAFIADGGHSPFADSSN